MEIEVGRKESEGGGGEGKRFGFRQIGRFPSLSPPRPRGVDAASGVVYESAGDVNFRFQRENRRGNAYNEFFVVASESRKKVVAEEGVVAGLNVGERIYIGERGSR